MSRLSVSAALLVIALVSALAPAAASAAASKSGYIRSADRVCRTYDRRIAALPAPPTGSPLGHHQQYVAWGTRVRTVFDAYDRALGTLAIPASAATFVASWHNVTKRVEAYVAAYIDFGAFANFKAEAKALVRANKRFGNAAADYGFANCGKRFRAGKLPH